MQAGKCGSCGKIVTAPTYRSIDAREHFGMRQLQCVSFACPHCEAIFGVETDPMAMMTDLTNRIAKRLGAK